MHVAIGIFVGLFLKANGTEIEQMPMFSGAEVTRRVAANNVFATRNNENNENNASYSHISQCLAFTLPCIILTALAAAWLTLYAMRFVLCSASRSFRTSLSSSYWSPGSNSAGAKKQQR